jgi:hypothetical protein
MPSSRDRPIAVPLRLERANLRPVNRPQKRECCQGEVTLAISAYDLKKSGVRGVILHASWR